MEIPDGVGDMDVLVFAAAGSAACCWLADRLVSGDAERKEQRDVQREETSAEVISASWLPRVWSRTKAYSSIPAITA